MSTRYKNNMDAENDNDQPNSSSASASITPSSSNNSSSSNLLGNLPMLPFMRSTDDDEHEDDDGGVNNDNDMMHEEPMPLQQPRSVEAAVGGELPQATNATAAEASSTSGVSSNDAAAEPMVRAVRDHLAVTVSSPFPSSAVVLALAESRRSLPFALLPSNANPSSSHVIFSPYLFNVLPNTSAQQQHQHQHVMDGLQQVEGQRPQLTLNTEPSTPQLAPHLVPVPASQTLDTTLSPQALTFISPSSFSSASSSSSSSSSSTSSHQSYNLAQHQEQIPIPSSSVSSSIPSQQQQDHQALPPPPQALQPPSSIVPSPSTPPREQELQSQQQQPQEQINRNDIADTIDASAVIVQPLETHAVQPPQAAAEEVERNQAGAAAEAFENDIQLDDNDNNDFDVDLNARNDSLAASASTSSAATASSRHQSPQAPQQQHSQQQLESLALDTSASGSAGTSGQTQPPTTLPLLLYQQPQQQTEESKHLPPSYDHHYHHHHHHHHNPREYHLHSQHPYQYPYDFASSLQQQKSSNGATGTCSHSSTMFGNSSTSAERNNGTLPTAGLEHGAGGGSGQVVDRLKLLYPNVNENETPLPRCWSPHDKCLSIGLSQNNLRVQFKGE